MLRAGPLTSRSIGRHSPREETLTTYIALFNLTEAGIKAAKDSPHRLDAAKKLLADLGAR